MNLQQFFDYRLCCPMCDDPLSTTFHSSRRQTCKYESDRFDVVFPFYHKGKSDGQNVVYSFGLQDHSFHVDFYKNNLRREECSKFLRDRFMDLHKNLKQFKFFRGCTKCRQYAYSSQTFPVNLKDASFPSLEIWSEEIGYSQLLEDGTYRILQLINVLGEKKSIFSFWNNSTDYASIEPAYHQLYKGSISLKLPLIPFVSKDETFARLRNLIVFT